MEQGHLDEAEIRLRAVLATFADSLIGALISEVLRKRSTRRALAHAAEREGLRFHHFQRVKVRLANGNAISVDSPWFRRAGKCGRRKAGPKKKGSSRKGCHLGLEFLGFEGKISPVLADEGLRLAATMPSLNLAAEHLAQEGRPVTPVSYTHLTLPTKA